MSKSYLSSFYENIENLNKEQVFESIRDKIVGDFKYAITINGFLKFFQDAFKRYVGFLLNLYYYV